MDDRGLEYQRQAEELYDRLLRFLAPVLITLDTQLDARLVRTVVGTIAALVCWRNRAHGLLLSELGAYVLSPAQAPAGTKRLSNLLRSSRWTGGEIERALWQQASARLAALEDSAASAYVMWDTSVLEKPESGVSTEFCPVRSSKAGRLTRYKRGPAAASALCAGPALARCAARGSQWATRRGGDALVDHPQGAGQ